MNNSGNHTATFPFEAERDIKPGRFNLVFLKLVAAVFIFLLQAPNSAQAQEETSYTVHANIIYHFTKYIDWPQDKKKGDFIIGVTGNAVLYNELKKDIAGKMVASQRIVIKTISSSARSFDCHILFIGDDESDNIKKIVSKTAGTSTLLLSESEGLAKKGSCINFVIVSDHLTLEINKTNIEQRNLDIASELLKLGKIVK